MEHITFNKLSKTTLLSFIFLCLISFWSAAVYRFYSLNNTGVAASLLLATISFIFLLKIRKKHSKPEMENESKLSSAGPSLTNSLLVAYFLLIMLCFYVLLSQQTTRALISPWQVVPNYFFILYSLTTLILIIISYQGVEPLSEGFDPLTLLISIHYFLSFSIALLIYKIGYGFDPFIHRATMELIDKIGSVDPRPFYYLGQYSLIVIIHKITLVPIVWLDKFLVPLLAAIYLPLISLYSLNKWLPDKKAIKLSIILFLALPFSFFIVTTPQNFSYLLLILVIMLGLKAGNIFDLIIIFILSLTALAVHPLAGVPAIIFSLLLTIYHANNTKFKKLLYSLIFILSSFALPLLFYLFEKNNSAELNLNGNAFNIFNALKKVAYASIPSVPGSENLFLNFIYFYFFNLKFIIIILAIFGIAIYFKYKNECRILKIYLIMSASLLISYVLTIVLPFNFLIDYEKSNFTDRILLMAILFLIPFFILVFYYLIDKLKTKALNIKIIFSIFAALIITTSLYLSYPRFDNYFNSRGYSVGENDIKAVNYIEKNAQADYIVLANQQVSAAALNQFGFKKYYESPLLTISPLLTRRGAGGEEGEEKIFYYPIPTGAPLYQYYLDMVYQKPSRATMLAAMNLAGVNEGYFVLNKYWWAFPKVLEEAKIEADEWQAIDDGEIYIFKYKK